MAVDHWDIPRECGEDSVCGWVARCCRGSLSRLRGSTADPPNLSHWIPLKHRIKWDSQLLRLINVLNSAHWLMGNKEASVSSVELLVASFIDHSFFLCANVWWGGGGGWTYVYLCDYLFLMFSLCSHFYIWSTHTVSQYVSGDVSWKKVTCSHSR